MTFREKLADLISGGALTSARDASQRQHVLYEEQLKRANKIAKQADGALDMCEKWRGKCEEARARLSRIASLETPRCAHIGKRMALIARGEAE